MFPTKILLATDGSEEANRAARMAMTLVDRLDSELHVAYVEPLPDPYAVPGATVYSPAFRDKVRGIADRDARKKLEVVAGKVKEFGEVAGTHALIGRPDVGIADLATKLGAGLVVVGSRGLGGLDRALMGSVSDSVVRHAHSPVLIVRSGDRDRETTTRTQQDRSRI